MVRLIGRLMCSAVLVAFVTAPSTAQPLDKRTYFTFSGPVAIPGTTLPAGEYLFRLANPESGRNVVQVMSADGTKALGMFFAMRAERRDASDKPEVSFIETAAGNPAAVRTWWYPGERSGFEFIYPKAQARQLAKNTSQPVLTTKSESTKAEETDTTDLSRVNSAGQDVNVTADSSQTGSAGRMQQGTIAQSNAPSNSQANAPANTPSNAQSNTQSNNRSNTQANQAAGRRNPTDPGAARQGNQSARAALPKTASLTPTVALAGFIMLLLAAAIWIWDGRRLAFRTNRQ